MDKLHTGSEPRYSSGRALMTLSTAFYKNILNTQISLLRMIHTIRSFFSLTDILALTPGLALAADVDDCAPGRVDTSVGAASSSGVGVGSRGSNCWPWGGGDGGAGVRRAAACAAANSLQNLSIASRHFRTQYVPALSSPSLKDISGRGAFYQPLFKLSKSKTRTEHT